MMVKRLLKIVLLLLILLLVLVYAVKRPSYVSESTHYFEGQVDSAKLEQHVKYLSHDISSRSYDELTGLNAASEYIKQQFISFGTTPIEQRFEVDGQIYQNIVVKYGPRAGEKIVVGAHYDAYNSMAGADDNASGVAGLIELGRLLATTELKYAIELVAYTLEEPPFFAGENMGSYVHAHSIEQPIKLMISLEMIGYFSDQSGSQRYPASLMGLIYPDQGNFIAVVDQFFSTQGQQLKNTFNKHSTLPAYSINAPAWVPGVDFSDHRNYWDKGIPAVMVTDTAFYRNDRYHTGDDTYETLDYRKMSLVVWGVYQHLIR